MACTGANIVISPKNLFWRIEAEHLITAVADVSDSLDGTYFTLMDDYYVWFNSSVGAAADPAPAGLTAIAVAFDPDDSAATIAGLIQAAIDAESDFSATVSGAEVTVVAAAVGEQADSADVDSGVTIAICRRGKNVDLGLVDGEPTLNSEPQVFDVTSQQTGTTPVSSIMTGVDVSVDVTLLETTKSKLQEFYKIWSGSTPVFTPSGGTEVFGMGTGGIGKNMLVEAARLEMIDVNSISAELSYQVNVMLSVPVPASLVFSGENPRTLEVSFKGYPDLSSDDRVNTVLIGDPTQTGL